MRNIQKQKEPESLKTYRCQPNSYFDGYEEKDKLREYLVQEQKGICCYCMQRIRPCRTSMKIEHWKSQTKYPKKQLSYGNLLGACIGGQCPDCVKGNCTIEGKHNDERKFHCDTKKGDNTLTYNPANHDVESKLKFLADGRIESDDPKLNEEIQGVLNLNEEDLINARKGVFDAFRQEMIQRKPSDSDLNKQLSKWNGDNGEELEPFCQVVIYYLRKKLRKKL